MLLLQSLRPSILLGLIAAKLLVNLSFNVLDHAHEGLAVGRVHHLEHFELLNHRVRQGLAGLLQDLEELLDLFLILGLLELLRQLQELLELVLLLVAVNHQDGLLTLDPLLHFLLLSDLILHASFDSL